MYIPAIYAAISIAWAALMTALYACERIHGAQEVERYLYVKKALEDEIVRLKATWIYCPHCGLKIEKD
jgi:hypothetical protein